MLILLGLELQRVARSRNLRAPVLPVFIRLVIGPLVGSGIGALFGLVGPSRQAGITEASMPTAVMTTILTSEYKLESPLVTAIILIGTILSPLTLTPLLYLLGR